MWPLAIAISTMESIFQINNISNLASLSKIPLEHLQLA
jgi:hypothetical protein